MRSGQQDGPSSIATDFFEVNQAWCLASIIEASLLRCRWLLRVLGDRRNQMIKPPAKPSAASPDLDFDLLLTVACRSKGSGIAGEMVVCSVSAPPRHRRDRAALCEHGDGGPGSYRKVHQSAGIS